MKRALIISLAAFAILACSPDGTTPEVGPLKEPEVPANPADTLIEPGSVDPSMYISTDFSMDGKIIQLQAAQEGAGIDIIVMGDAFTDRLIASGEYDTLMGRVVEAFFSEEPYKSFRHLFNVYQIYAVSKCEVILDPVKDKQLFYSDAYSTACGSFLGGSSISGEYNLVRNYLEKLFPQEPLRIDDATVIVLCNKHNSYLGSCLMLPCMELQNSTKNWSNGLSISFLTLGVPNVSLGYEDFSDLVCHEAAGHGFGKFADEYVNSGNATATMTSSERNTKIQNQQKGWDMNVSFSPDSLKAPWRHFLEDERYDGCGLGVFEGCATYGKGVYRPTKNGIMNSNQGGFSAIEREVIYKRIHKTAFGNSWNYDYEEFVEWDSINRNSAPASLL